jgi:hypothetical protein
MDEKKIELTLKRNGNLIRAIIHPLLVNRIQDNQSNNKNKYTSTSCAFTAVSASDLFGTCVNDYTMLFQINKLKNHMLETKVIHTCSYTI